MANSIQIHLPNMGRIRAGKYAKICFPILCCIGPYIRVDSGSNLSSDGIPRLEHSYHIVWDIWKTYSGHLSMACSCFGYVQALPCSQPPVLSCQAPALSLVEHPPCSQDQWPFAKHPLLECCLPGPDLTQTGKLGSISHT